jgi:predicted alpha/beta superfamily hydrolase
MKIVLTMLLLTGCVQAQAQHAVTFQLKSLPPYHATGSSIFVAGNFNNWKPDSTGFGTTGCSLTISLPKGMYEYKFTRGSWQNSEAGAGGAALANRTLTVNGDTAITIEIKEWADHFSQLEKKSTASKNTYIVDTAFYIPQLNRYRRIWIYLPDDYASSPKKYPVLYMHDGQNVFDEKTAYAGEWGVDEMLDTKALQTRESIVVAIDHGGEKRINEYSPFDMEKYGKGEGDLYLDFIVKTLKPYVEKKYRVKKCRRHQAIAGSSMGGLISFYAMLRYPNEFGAAGVFSPAFWIAPQLKDAIAPNAKKVKGKIYFYAGKQESSRMVPGMLAVFEQMSKYSKAKMTLVIRTEGAHNEARWRQEFPLFYMWWRGPRDGLMPAGKW